MFDNVRRLIEAAGGTPDDIVKMTVWIADRGLRPTLNKYWVEMFPDPHSRPARHTVAHGDFTPPMQIQCDLFAVIAELHGSSFDAPQARSPADVDHGS